MHRKTGSRPGPRLLVAWLTAQLSISSQGQPTLPRSHENDDSVIAVYQGRPENTEVKSEWDGTCLLIRILG